MSKLEIFYAVINYIIYEKVDWLENGQNLRGDITVASFGLTGSATTTCPLS